MEEFNVDSKAEYSALSSTRRCMHIAIHTQLTILNYTVQEIS